ncbi:uncharacterized protein [Dermacentor andersoni]|uniref:uncharacterized protein n=1 Tax=Dermacentor andersoni TaxID=34620 RepID=UPI002155C370|nr:uncharacterized protein LOC126528356 [Dermacentor andersoni]
MTSMSNTAIYIFILAFFKSAVCQVCRPHSIEACYGAIAMSLLRDLVKPPFGEIELDASMQTICKKRFPSVSRCKSLVNDCPKEQRENFTNLENIYRGFHNAVCTQDSFDGLRSLWDCLDRPRRKRCDKDTDTLFSTNSLFLHCQTARNYSACLEEVTRDCPPNYDEGKKALKRITNGTVDTLCSSWRDLQATPSSLPEGNTANFTDLFERQHTLKTSRGDATTVHSLFNGSTTMTSELPHMSVTSQISSENVTAGNPSLCLDAAGTSGTKCNDSNVVAPSSATSVSAIAFMYCAFVCASSWLTLLNL